MTDRILTVVDEDVSWRIMLLGITYSCGLAMLLDLIWGTSSKTVWPLSPLCGFALGSYTATLIVTRYQHHGGYSFYETLWGCNMSLIFTTISLWSQRPFLMMMSMCIVSGDQLCWYLDIFFYLFLGKCPIGVMRYLTYPENQSWPKRIFASHHLWFLPFCIYHVSLLEVHDRMPWTAFVASCLVTSLLVVFCRYATPYEIHFPGQRAIYLNINGAYAFWRDVPIPFLHAFDDAPMYVYLAYLCTVGNFCVNGLPSLFIRYIARHV